MRVVKRRVIGIGFSVLLLVLVSGLRPVDRPPSVWSPPLCEPITVGNADKRTVVRDAGPCPTRSPVAGAGGWEWHPFWEVDRSEARAIDVATRTLAERGGSTPRFVEARRGAADCSAGSCPTVWWVTFRATTEDGQAGTAVAVVDATTFEYLYTDWTIAP